MHVPILVARDVIALLIEPLGSPLVLSFSAKVRGPVKLHDQFAPGAIEVGDETSDRDLPAELGPVQSSITKTPPKLSLSRRGFVAHSSCQRQEVGINTLRPM